MGNSNGNLLNKFNTEISISGNATNSMKRLFQGLCFMPINALIPIMEFQWIDSLGLWEKWFSLDGTT